MMMIEGGSDKINTVSDYIKDKKTWYKEVILVEKDMEKTLLKYFTKDYDFFIKTRKKEVINKKSATAFIQKLFISKESLYFKDKSYQSSGMQMIFRDSFPIINRRNVGFPILDEDSDKNYYEIKKAYNLYNQQKSFIDKKSFDLLKNTWKDYIDYLMEIKNTNKEVKLRSNLKSF
jgi:hypothetical protein